MVAGQRIPNQFVPQVAADIVDLAAVPPANRFNKIYKQVRGWSSVCGWVCACVPSLLCACVYVRVRMLVYSIQ